MEIPLGLPAIGIIALAHFCVCCAMYVGLLFFVLAEFPFSKVLSYVFSIAMLLLSLLVGLPLFALIFIPANYRLSQKYGDAFIVAFLPAQGVASIGQAVFILKAWHWLN